MRKIDWDKKLSPEDIAFLRQTGILGIEDRIKANLAEHDAEVPDPEVPKDPATKSALDPTVTKGDPTGEGVVQRVDPTGGVEDVDLEDDYDEWPTKDLESEVSKRNDIEGKTPVEVVGTGRNGNVLKADFIKALRLWDQTNPEA